MVDFDDLKQLNEQTDYIVGDQVLIAIGRALSAETRPSDTAGRLGGDEFMLVVPGAGLEQLEKRARALSERLERLEVLPAAQPFYRGASVGCASVERGEATEDAIRHASEQMRSQKRRRKTDRIIRWLIGN
jgi:diguanylate cyclase (GGDEF)-like protein